ncbi:MAG: hypothetical protein GY795_36425 [Desulfobacterales bacterium]|nr:hypothetical protein [Desulfobacterales bacterium]
MGIICHFIKKEEKNRKNKPFFGDQYLTCRHEDLRNSLFKQASVIKKIREKRRDLGKFIVGVDGAGNELKTPPEVFAPVFRHIMSEFNHFQHHSIFTNLSGDKDNHIPPLKFTFHVGEEFHHLLSGLRAVDEAVTFIKLPPGSRLGHALALGFDPMLWYERSQAIRLPQLEWLDNLVWFYYQLPGFPEFKIHLADEIQRYTLKVYKNNFPPQLLHQAWQFRELGWTRKEKNLPSHETRHEELQKLLPDEAFDLAELYHYNVGVWNRGRKIIQVDFKKEHIHNWINALKSVQEKMIQKAFQQQICIEACPLSNLRISQLRKLREHPIFRWHHPNPNVRSPRISVLVATDNTGIFQSSLPLEYSALARAAEDTDNPPDIRQTEEWLERIRADTETYSFLDNLHSFSN